MAKTLEFEVQTDEALEDWFNRIALNLDSMLENLIEILAEYGYWFAIFNLEHIDTGKTLASIQKNVNGNEAEVVAGGAAIWIEFGTGVVKNVTAHPEPVESDIPILSWGTYGKGNGKNPKGWFYPTTDIRYAVKRKDGSYLTDANGNYIAHTYGIPANYFMYNSGREVANYVPYALARIFI